MAYIAMASIGIAFIVMAHMVMAYPGCRCKSGVGCRLQVLTARDTSETNKNAFENGQTDVFHLELPNVGELRKLQVAYASPYVGIADGASIARVWTCWYSK